MTDLTRIEYRDKNGDLYEERSRRLVPHAGDFVQLNKVIYPIEEVFWIDEDGLRVVVVIGKPTKRIPFNSTANYGNW